MKGGNAKFSSSVVMAGLRHCTETDIYFSSNLEMEPANQIKPWRVLHKEPEQEHSHPSVQKSWDRRREKLETVQEALQLMEYCEELERGKNQTSSS